MGNINKKVDKLIAKRQWDKLLHNLGETNGESKMKIAKPAASPAAAAVLTC